MLAPPLSTGDGSSVLEGRRHSESKTQTESMQSQLSLCFSASKSRGAVLYSIFFPPLPLPFPFLLPQDFSFPQLPSRTLILHFQYSRIKRNHLPSCKIPSFAHWKFPNLSFPFWKKKTQNLILAISFPCFHLGETWSSMQRHCLLGFPRASHCIS